MAKSMDAMEKQWRAESDARTLADAEAIRNDPKRISEASKAAKKMVADQKKAATDAAARARAMDSLASKGTKKAKKTTTKPKPSARRSAPKAGRGRKK